MKYLSFFLLLLLADTTFSQQDLSETSTMADAKEWEKTRSTVNAGLNSIDLDAYQWRIPENEKRKAMPFFKPNFNPKEVNFYISSELQLALNWKVSNNKGVSHYEIERFGLDQWFEHLQVIASDRGILQEEPYVFNDVQPLKGISNYRIIQVMQSGERRFSPIYSLKYDRPAENIVLVSKPESDLLEVIVTNDEKPISMFFFNEEGKIVGKYAVKKRDKIDISRWLPGMVSYDILGKGYEAHGVILVD